jgi:hypothetical protein
MIHNQPGFKVLAASADVDEAQKAVLWFTATVPVFITARGATVRLVVRAPGYRLGPAGDA